MVEIYINYYYVYFYFFSREDMNFYIFKIQLKYDISVGGHLEGRSMRK
jgi:hypothetical protein